MPRSAPATIRLTPEVQAALEQIWTDQPYLRDKFSATVKQAIFAYARSSTLPIIQKACLSNESVAKTNGFSSGEAFSDNDNF